MLSPTFWDDTGEAQRISKEKSRLEKEIAKWQDAERALEDLDVFIELSTEEGDGTLFSEIKEGIKALRHKLEQIEIETLLSGDMDMNNAIVSIHPGAGGTESQDWAQMLMRLYTRWAERNGYKIEILDYQPGDEAGIKDVTFSVIGDYAYGYLKAESGVHRLVRISPFDANKRRHTSFSSVFVYPEIEDDITVEISEDDLRIDTYRASGAGGPTLLRLRKPDGSSRTRDPGRAPPGSLLLGEGPPLAVLRRGGRLRQALLDQGRRTLLGRGCFRNRRALPEASGVYAGGG